MKEHNRRAENKTDWSNELLKLGGALMLFGVALMALFLSLTCLGGIVCAG